MDDGILTIHPIFYICLFESLQPFLNCNQGYPKSLVGVLVAAACLRQEKYPENQK